MVSLSVDKRLLVWDTAGITYDCLQELQDRAVHRPIDRLSAMLWDPKVSHATSLDTHWTLTGHGSQGESCHVTVHSLDTHWTWIPR